MTDEIRYRTLKLLRDNPNISQRGLALELGVSLGKANYCLKALVGKGLVKMRNFQNSSNKSGYAYFLTPKGVEEKAKVTVRFLQRKMTEYEELKQQVAELRSEVAALEDTTEREQ